MSSYNVFADEGALEKIIPKPLLVFSSAIVMLLVGAGMLFVSLTMQTPTDIFSTGLWYDQQVKLVFDSTFTAVSFISNYLPQQVSVEGSAVGIMIWLAQITMAIHLARTGGWLKNEEINKRIGLFTFISRAYQGHIKSESVNWSKVNGTLVLLFVILIDTYTDTVWKVAIGSGFLFWVKTFGISMFINTFLSEWCLVEGFRTGLMGLILVKRNYKEALTAYHKEGRPEPQPGKPHNKTPHESRPHQQNHHGRPPMEEMFNIPGTS